MATPDSPSPLKKRGRPKGYKPQTKAKRGTKKLTYTSRVLSFMNLISTKFNQWHMGYKLPLIFSNLLNSYYIGWYIYSTAPTDMTWLNAIVSILSAVAFDATIISTSFLPKFNLYDWLLSIVTSLVALGFSVGIIMHITNDPLHIGWAILGTCFAWLLAINPSLRG